MEVLPIGHGEGFRDTTISTSIEYVDLSAYKGRYVHIQSDQGFYWVFMPSAAGGSITAQAAETSGVMARCMDGETGVHRVVPHDRPFLAYRSIAASPAATDFVVTPTSQKVV